MTAWVEGEQVAPIVARIPPDQVALATEMARITCERLRFLARRAENEGLQVVPMPKSAPDPMVMRRQVQRLLERKKQHERREA